MCGAEPMLADFPDPAALFDALHGPGGDPDARNAILAALVRQAQAGAEAAATLLLLALWPGLDAVYRRLVRHFRGEPDVLVSEISARVVAGIHGLDLARVNRIAATLIRNCERDIVRALQRRTAETRCCRSTRMRQVVARAHVSVARCPTARADEAVARLVDVLEPVVGADAPLVVAIAVVGERQQDAAAALGLSHEAGRKRYQRALKRLRVVVDEIV